LRFVSIDIQYICLYQCFDDCPYICTAYKSDFIYNMFPRVFL